MALPALRQAPIGQPRRETAPATAPGMMDRDPDPAGAVPPRRPEASRQPSRAKRPSSLPGRAAQGGERCHAERQARPMAVREAAGRARHPRRPSPQSPRTRRDRAIPNWPPTRGGSGSAQVPGAGSGAWGRKLTSGRNDTVHQEASVGERMRGRPHVHRLRCVAARARPAQPATVAAGGLEPPTPALTRGALLLRKNPILVAFWLSTVGTVQKTYRSVPAQGAGV
jgi:hypothetical protein